MVRFVGIFRWLPFHCAGDPQLTPTDFLQSQYGSVRALLPVAGDVQPPDMFPPADSAANAHTCRQSQDLHFTFPPYSRQYLSVCFSQAASTGAISNFRARSRPVFVPDLGIPQLEALDRADQRYLFSEVGMGQ